MGSFIQIYRGDNGYFLPCVKVRILFFCLTIGLCHHSPTKRNTLPMKNDIFIGIDLGGTNVRAGAVTADGELLACQDTPIEAHLGPQIGVEKIAGLITRVAEQVGGRVQAIGIGSTGPIDRDLGAIQNPYTLPTWENVDIVRLLRERFHVPATIENDADAAALGESWMGAGRGLQRLLLVTVGTGVGTAFILNGMIYRGAGGVHCEGGHMILDPSGPECYCGAKGCWESLASGTAIGAYAREQASAQTTLMTELTGGDLQRIDAAIVAEASRRGDPLAGAIISRVADYFGLGLVNLIVLFMPDCIVLTGGVLQSFDLMEARILEVIRRHNLMVPADKVTLRPAQLGQQAGVIGAARAGILLLESLS
jgi:glucokinase